MIRTWFGLLSRALLVALCLVAEMKADDELTSAPAPNSSSVAQPPAALSPGSLEATGTEQPGEDSGTPSGSSSPARGRVESTDPRDGVGEKSFTLLDRKPSELGLGYRSTGLGWFIPSPKPVRLREQPGQIDKLALLGSSPSELALSYRLAVFGWSAQSPPQTRSSLQPLPDNKPPEEAPGVQSTVTGPTRLPALIVHSDPKTGQGSWSTLLDGKPIDTGFGWTPADPGLMTLGRSETMTRFGWWGGGQTGSPLKVGEYQGLGTSPFWDIDTIQSNGTSTVDLWASQLNSEAWDVRSHFYQNGFTANVDFEQFPHLLENSLPGGGSSQSTNQVVTDNMSVGQDSAVRVQQLKVALKGPLTQNIQWKFQFWMFRKFGDRQANSMAHCFNMNLVGGQADNRCHVVSQMQNIDWLTLEVEPGLIAKFNNVTVDYTRTMRYFTPNDQTVFAPFTQFGAFGGSNGPTIYPYAITPNSVFQMDRLKVGVDLTERLKLYSYLYNGLMTNLDRNTNNQFGGFDFRMIETLNNGMTGTAYVKLYENRSQLPPYLLPEEGSSLGLIRHPINYTRWWAGLDGQWFPFRDSATVWQGMSLRANYEYHQVDYQYATYPTDVASTYIVPPTVTNAVVTNPYFTQPTTRINKFVLAQRMRWATGVNTFARYQFTITENPMYGMTPLSGALNTNIPTNEQLFEVGGSWAPMSNLLFSAQASLQTMWLKSNYVNGAATNYPLVFTAWYAPTPKWSLSAGYSYYSNWINQDITMGYRGLDEPPPAETLRMGFKGQTSVVNVGGRYAWSEKLSLTAGIFYTNGLNVFNVPPSQTGANWSTMPTYANVLAQSVRYQGGFDYKFTETISSYFRVNVFDYLDKSQGIGSGTAFYFLGGLTAAF